MKLTYVMAILLGFASLTQLANAQDKGTKQQVKKPATPEEEKRLLRNHFQGQLGVDSAKAEKVLGIQSAYKSAMRALEADTSLSEQIKLTKRNLIIQDKNNRLKLLLNQEQQKKIIPTSELGTTPKAPLKKH